MNGWMVCLRPIRSARLFRVKNNGNALLAKGVFLCLIRAKTSETRVPNDILDINYLQ